MLQTAASHSTYANILKSDFEQPVRDLPNKMTAWRRIGDQESSLERTLKDYEKVSIKLDKAASKSKSSKAEQLQHELSQLTSQLNQLTPATYSTFQRLDEERLRALKEVVVRWATLRGDMATKAGERAETAVASVLGWEPTDEVISVGNRLSRAHNGSEVRASPSGPLSGGVAGTGNLSVESTRTLMTANFADNASQPPRFCAVSARSRFRSAFRKPIQRLWPDAHSERLQRPQVHARPQSHGAES